MRNEMEFVLYWKVVRERFLPLLEQEKIMWEKAKRKDNVEQIETELKPCLNITSYEAAKDLLIICKEQERVGQLSPLSPLKSLFTELKNIIVTVAKETPHIPNDYLDFISKQVSPRAYAIIANSRWAKLKESSSGSETENQDTGKPNIEFDGQLPTERCVQAEIDLLPRSTPTKEAGSLLDVHNSELNGTIPKFS